MFIESRNYQLKTYNKDIFIPIHNNEFPISFVEGIDGKCLYSSRQDLFMKVENKSKKIAEFSSHISSLSIHQNLICAGSRSGDIHIFNLNRQSLRNYSEHSAPVNNIIITEENIVISCSDDSRIKLFNLEDEKSFKTICQNDGYIKCMDVYDRHLYVGSKNINVYSLDTYKNLYKYEHGQTISKICAIDNQNIIFSSKNKIYWLNIEHNKIVQTVYFAKDISKMIKYRNLLYVSSLDGHFKTFSYDLKLINDFMINDQILDLSVRNDQIFMATDNHAIYGLPKSKSKKIENQTSGPIRPKYEDEIKFEVIDQAKRRCSDIEKLLRNYEFKKCLKLVFEKKNIEVSYSVFKTIQDERGLMKALKDEKEDFLESFLLFCIDHLRIQEFFPILMEALTIITTIYVDLIEENNNIRELLLVISDIINEELAFQELCIKSISFLSCFE